MNKSLDMLGDYIRNIEEELYIAERTIDLKQQKIDKAIKWVYNIQQDKDNKHLEPYIATDELDKLLEILGDKENE